VFAKPLPSNGHILHNILTNVTYSSNAYIIKDSKLSEDYIISSGVRHVIADCRIL
jgi:hypothetical protein